MRVVVVGNSRDLLNNNHGKRIDDFDRIIRINAFRLDGHAAQVGSRIDIVSICLAPESLGTSVKRSSAVISQAREFWTPSWRGKFSEEHVSGAMALFHRDPQELVFCDDTGHKAVIMAIYQLRAASTIASAHDCEDFYPTTGFQTIHLVEARFAGAQIYITGFGLDSPLDLRRFSTSNAVIWGGHDITFERAYLEECVSAGRFNKL
jgi:hypothetical protein